MGFWHNLVYGKKKKKGHLDMRKSHIIIHGQLDPPGYWKHVGRLVRADKNKKREK